jgi:hypothetical protein
VFFELSCLIIVVKSCFNVIWTSCCVYCLLSLRACSMWCYAVLCSVVCVLLTSSRSYSKCAMPLDSQSAHAFIKARSEIIKALILSSVAFAPRLFYVMLCSVMQCCVCTVDAISIVLEVCNAPGFLTISCPCQWRMTLFLPNISLTSL